jgi:hypothetical protein
MCLPALSELTFQSLPRSFRHYVYYTHLVVPYVRTSIYTGWGISRLTLLYPTNGLSYAPGSHYIVVVTHFVKLYPQPLYTCYTASQVRTTSRSWDKGVLTYLCLSLYIDGGHIEWNLFPRPVGYPVILRSMSLGILHLQSPVVTTTHERLFLTALPLALTTM